MKKFKSEFLNRYNTYTFSFAEYAIKESIEDIPTIYNSGYLPYTGDLSINYSLFYMSRSLRVNLNSFTDSSENRRVNRKMEDITPKIRRHLLADFNYNDPIFIDFCLSYAGERFSGNVMNKERFKYIMDSEIATDIFEFTNSNDGKLLGYVLAVIYGDTFHYWFSFFNTEYLQNIPLGKWMMWKMIKWSKDNNLNYTYLGTAYGTKALYKIRDFKGLEFFNGNFWDNDIKTIKNLCKTDNEIKEKDFFKSIDGKNQYIEKLINNI